MLPTFPYDTSFSQRHSRLEELVCSSVAIDQDTSRGLHDAQPLAITDLLFRGALPN